MPNTTIKQFRERHGLTQGALGVALGIEEAKAQSRISHYESGRREVPTDVAYALIDFAATKNELMTLEEVLPRPSASEA